MLTGLALSVHIGAMTYMCLLCRIKGEYAEALTNKGHQAGDLRH